MFSLLIYLGIPHNAEGVLKIDPGSDSVDVLEGTNGPLPSGKWKWHVRLIDPLGFNHNASSFEMPG
jgi:hypothetical protein